VDIAMAKKKKKWVRWSKDEVRLLKRLFPLGKAKRVAEKTGRALKAVQYKAYDMGLGTRQNRRWSASEIEILKRLYLIETARSIADRLGRSEETVRMKARSIGVSKAKRRLHWSEQEDALLKKLYPDPNNTKAAMAEQLGRSIYAIGVRAHRLGLKKKRRKA
jgi:hypothetical protein